MSFFDNTRKPDGLGGKLMVSLMNVGHRSLAHWGMRFLPLRRMPVCWTAAAAAEQTSKSS